MVVDGAELSTVSTPSTVETTVEASETLSSKGEQGGSGGKEGKPTDDDSRAGRRGLGLEAPGSGFDTRPLAPLPTPAGALNPAWARALHSAASCALGRCAYADPAKRPNRWMAAQGCDGYHASEHIDPDGRVTVRWYLCPRHVEWWRQERIRVNAAKVVRLPHAGLGPER